MTKHKRLFITFLTGMYGLEQDRYGNYPFTDPKNQCQYRIKLLKTAWRMEFKINDFPTRWANVNRNAKPMYYKDPNAITIVDDQLKARNQERK